MVVAAQMSAHHWSDSMIKGCPRVYGCCSENCFKKSDFKLFNSHRQVSCLENAAKVSGETREGKTGLLGHEGSADLNCSGIHVHDQRIRI